MILTMAGGIGGAKLVLGFSRLLAPRDLAVVANTGDDILLHGLRVCPDVDTIAYTLAGVANPETGWGIAGDTFECLRSLNRLGAETWFQLGDRDLATHIRRTSMLNQGVGLTEATSAICLGLGVQCRVLPMSDGFHPTLLETDLGTFHLQEYLVRERCRPTIRRVLHRDIERSRVTPQVEAAVQNAKAIIFCPSNPFISIGPILAVGGMRELLKSRRVPKVAVSPIVGGKALKGPAAKMLEELGHPVSAVSVARLYQGLIDRFVLDRADADLADEIESLGIEAQIADTLMNTLEDKIRLASELSEKL